MHGRCSLERICEFGERVSWYVPKKRRTKLEPTWLNGVFLVRDWSSDQNFIGLADGSVTRARAMVRVVESQRWVAARVLGVAGTPTSLSTTGFDVIEEEQGDRRPRSIAYHRPITGLYIAYHRPIIGERDFKHSYDRPITGLCLACYRSMRLAISLS